jgi:hypothetical protein
MILANFTVKIQGFNPSLPTKYSIFSIGLIIETTVIDAKINYIFREFQNTFMMLFMLPILVGIGVLLILEIM